MPTESDRRQLFDALEHSLGPVPAATLMELLPPVGWGDVARRADLDATASSLRGEMAQLRAELTGGMTELRAELTAGMTELRGHIDAQLWRFVLAMVPIVIAVAGLVLASVHFA